MAESAMCVRHGLLVADAPIHRARGTRFERSIALPHFDKLPLHVGKLLVHLLLELIHLHSDTYHASIHRHFTPAPHITAVPWQEIPELIAS